MVVQLYVIRDLVANESGPIFEAKNDYVAHRHFEMIASKCPYRKELELLRIGRYDHEDDICDVLDEPQNVTPSLKMEMEDDPLKEVSK